MTFAIETTSVFERNLRKFLRKYPQLASRVDRIIADLHEDPWQPHLQLHALRGSFQGYHAARIDYSKRVVLVLRAWERQSVLVAIGVHDEVYR